MSKEQERTYHDDLQDCIEAIWINYGVRVDSFSVKWVDVSTDKYWDFSVDSVGVECTRYSEGVFQ